MRIGFLVWNRFQVGHFAEIIRHFDGPDVIFIDRDVKGLEDFDPQWLTQYGAYTRFLSEIEIGALDGQYDAILTQFTPPLKQPWSDTKLIMTQYSMAKPKTAYNARWLASDFGLVYGQFSERIIGQMCPTARMGNPRFDPYFEKRLDQGAIDTLRSHLDPTKRTLAFLPTWGDLSSQAKFKQALDTLLPHYNIIYKPHHMTSIKGAAAAKTLGRGAIDADSVLSVLDTGPYIMEVADVVASDMSGIIFDALYCGKPVVLLGLDQNFAAHKKADPTALEIAETHRIGPVVTDPDQLLAEIDRAANDHPFSGANDVLVSESFVQRGHCGALAASSIRHFLTAGAPHHQIHDYAASTVRSLLLEKAYLTAEKRSSTLKSKEALRAELLSRRRSVLKKSLAALPASLLVAVAKMLGAIKLRYLESFFYYRAVESSGASGSAEWVQNRRARRKDITLLSMASRKKLLASLQESGDFFGLGRAVESWASSSFSIARQALYNFYCAASNVRFSRVRFRQVHASLLEMAEASETPPNIKRAILRDLGFLHQAAEAGSDDPGPSQNSLVETLVFLGEGATLLERAAMNDGCILDDQLALTPDGAWTAVRDLSSRIFEMSINLNFTRALTPNDDGARKAMLGVTRSMVQALLDDGWSVLPRIQAGYRGAPTVTGKYPSATWHTIYAGLPGQVHLKVGTFNSHIIIDDRGFSGWSSIARKSLPSIISGVPDEDAEKQMRYLHETFVESGRSKFKQTSGESAPDTGSYVFFPMQIITDSVAKLAYVDGLTVLKTLADWGQSSPYKVVVKRHPNCSSCKIADALNVESRLGRILLSNAPVHSLIAGASAVVTVNSGAGAEALLHLKPVITTGDSDYGAATTLVRTEGDLIDALNRLPELAVNESDVKKFLWVYSKRYQVHLDDEQAIKNRVQELIKVPSEYK